jgi:light-regulated signal transduction histidine kinase (bacteriophytochrome)
VLEPVPLDEPLDAAATALSTAIEETSAVIERPGSLPEVRGDATLLGMLWQNLIGNAIKFRAADRAPVIRITADEQPDGRWQLGVADNGIGVPAEFAEKIFIIFQRLHARDAYPGTGIGLALCKRIVEQHGGEMFLDTAYSGGTRIYFTLPAPDTPAARLPDRAEIIGTLTLTGPAGPGPGEENPSTSPEGTTHVRPGTDRSPARRG